MNALFVAFQPWIEVWADSLWRATWQGGIALLVAWAVARWCTSLSPRVICWVYRLACIKIVVALFWSTPISLPVLAPQPEIAATADATPHIARDTDMPSAGANRSAIVSAQGANVPGDVDNAAPNFADSHDADLQNVPAPGAVADSTLVPGLAESADEQAVTFSKEPATAKTPGFAPTFGRLLWARLAILGRAISGNTFKGIVCICWGVGALICATSLVMQWCAVRGLMQRSVPARKKSLLNVCQTQAARLGVGRLPRLRISRELHGPAFAGIWQPTILFPRSLSRSFDRKDLALIAGHELAHFKRHDLMWNWLLMIVRCLFFYHPLVWMTARGWSIAQEAACDELVIQGGICRPAEYVRLLLSLATRGRNMGLASTSFAASSVFGAYADLEWRAMALARVRPLSKKQLTLAAGAFVLVLIVAVIPWRLVAREALREATGELAAMVATYESEQDRAAALLAARKQSLRNMQRLFLAMRNYADVHAGELPRPYVSNDGTPLLSWRVAILPYLDDEPGAMATYREFHLNEPWDSPHNKPLIARMPAIFRSPLSPELVGRTVYVSPRGAAGGQQIVHFDDVGARNKVAALVEVNEDQAVAWTQPTDWTFSRESPRAGIGKLHEGGFYVGLCDGTTRFIPAATSGDTLNKLFSLAASEPAQR